MFKEPNSLEEKLKLCDDLVECFIMTMPTFQYGLSSTQKRDLIRKHIGDLKLFENFKKYPISKNMIFARTCQVLAENYNLNDPIP